jgi:hypothetical protein
VDDEEERRADRPIEEFEWKQDGDYKKTRMRIPGLY